MPTKDALERYDQLIVRYRGLIVRVCQIYCRHDADRSRDLYQDIALKIWTKMDTFRGECNEATWIWRIAVNTAIDELRRDRQQYIIAASEVPDKSEAENTQQIDDLYEAIAHLPADDQLIVAYRLDGFSYDDIAQLTNLSEGSLRVRYNRIVKQLKTMLNNR